MNRRIVSGTLLWLAVTMLGWPTQVLGQIETDEAVQPAPAELRLVPPIPDEEEEPARTATEAVYERRLDELEARVADLVAEVGQQSDDVSLEAQVEELRDSILGRFEENEQRFLDELSHESDRIVNGRIHLDVWDFPKSSPGINLIESGNPNIDPEDRIEYRRVRFGVRGSIPPENMSYRVELEFGGDDGGRVRDAWLAWDDLALFQTIRVGNQKRPYGLDSLNSSNFNIFLERPMIVDAFNENARRVGAVSYGASRDTTINWRWGVYDLRQIQDAGSIRSDRFQPEIAYRISTLLLDGCQGQHYWHVGIAGNVAFPDGFAFQGNRDDNQARFRAFPEGRSSERWINTGRIRGAETYEIAAFESVLNIGPLQVGGEYMNLWLQRADGFGQSLDFKGGYVYVSYFLTGEYLPWNRQLGTLGRLKPINNFWHARRIHGPGAWQVAFRASRADLNDEDINGGLGDSLTAAMNWYWNAHSRLQFNYLWGRIDDRLLRTGVNQGAIVSGSYQIAGVRFMIDY